MAKSAVWVGKCGHLQVFMLSYYLVVKYINTGCCIYAMNSHSPWYVGLKNKLKNVFNGKKKPEVETDTDPEFNTVYEKMEDFAQKWDEDAKKKDAARKEKHKERQKALDVRDYWGVKFYPETKVETNLVPLHDAMKEVLVPVLAEGYDGNGGDYIPSFVKNAHAEEKLKEIGRKLMLRTLALDENKVKNIAEALRALKINNTMASYNAKKMLRADNAEEIIDAIFIMDQNYLDQDGTLISATASALTEAFKAYQNTVNALLNLVEMPSKQKSAIELNDIVKETGERNPYRLMQIFSYQVGDSFNPINIAKKLDEIESINQYLNSVAGEQGRSNGVVDPGRTNDGISALTEYSNDNIEPLLQLMAVYAKRGKLLESDNPTLNVMQHVLSQYRKGPEPQPILDAIYNNPVPATQMISAAVVAGTKNYKKLAKDIRKTYK